MEKFTAPGHVQMLDSMIVHRFIPFSAFYGLSSRTASAFSAFLSPPLTTKYLGALSDFWQQSNMDYKVALRLPADFCFTSIVFVL